MFNVVYSALSVTLAHANSRSVPTGVSLQQNRLPTDKILQTFLIEFNVLRRKCLN